MSHSTNLDIRIYEYISEPGIFHNVRDFRFGTPKYNYDRVMVEIRDKSNKNVCNRHNCRFKTRPMFGTLTRIPVLIRQTHATCEICNSNSLSDYDHNACFECANVDDHPEEFHYFHRFC